MDQDRSGSAAPAAKFGAEDYLSMVDSVRDYAMYFLDTEGHVATWNAGAQRINGYDASEVIGRHFSVFYPPESISRGWPLYELQVARESGRFEDEGWRVRKDGTRFWANVVITRVLDAGGRLRGFFKISRDMTEKRNQQEMLRLSEERFRVMVEGVRDYAIFMLDPGGHIVSWNSGAEQTKGYTAGEIIGRHFSVFYPADVARRGWPQHELQVALETGRYEEEGWRVRKNGDQFWANVVITPLYDDARRHVGFAKVTRDLTERRRVSALEDEGRRMSTFLAMLGHELRNPLAPITYALSNLQQDAPQSPEMRRFLDVIGRQLKQLSGLVDDLLEIGRITNGKIVIERRPVCLDHAVLEAAEALEPAIKEKSHALSLELDTTKQIWVEGDPMRIVQIIVNLLGNAAKFTPPGGQLSVALREVGSLVEIRVKDNGIGIPPAMLPDVFKMFVQGNADPALPQSGLGLGLTLVSELASLHGGDVAAFSTGVPGQGTEVIVRLATIPPPEAPTSDDQPAPPPIARKLLVVDDNRDAADMLSMLLNLSGYRTTTVYDGVSAVEAALRERPDAVLLDIGLPGLSGIEVARRIREALADAPPKLIALTGFGSASDRHDTLQVGFSAHLTKPVGPDELLGLLATAFDTPAGDRGGFP